MFEKLANGIPLHEAAAYFIKLKDFTKVADASTGGGSTYAPPDETGELEGKFSVPVEQVLAQMAKMVQNELKTNYAYMVYANSLRDHAHFAVANEFEDHAHNETEHADWLLRRMSVLGGPVNVPDIPAPPASTELHDILQTMVRMEQEGIENWRILRQMIGDENPSKFKVEEYLTREQEHLDELWQMMPAEANPAIMAQRAGSTPSTSLPPMPGMSEPDTNTQPKEPPAQGTKTASARIERFHPDTLHMHGEAMKLALQSGGTRGTTIVPDIGLDGHMKTAAAKLRKAAEGMAPAPLPPTAMGQQQAPQPPPPLTGPAAGQVMKQASLFKRALSEMTVPTGSAQTPGVSSEYGTPEKEPPGAVAQDQGMPPAPPQLDPQTAAYLQKEQEGQMQEQQAQENFYKQKFEQASQALMQAQEQAQAAAQQQEQLQQQADQTGQQQQAAMAQAQQIQQAAMQNAQAAHQAATQAMQQSLQAQQETIRQQELAVGMRDAVHAMRQSLMQQIQQQLPPATTAEANAAAIDQANANAPTDMNAQAAGGGQQDNSSQPGAEGQQQPANTAGAPNSAPDAGTPMNAPSPGGAGPDNSPSSGTTSPPRTEGAVATTQTGQAQEQPDNSRYNAAKVGSAHDQLIGAILGGAAGGLGGFAESKMSNDPLRQKVKMLEQHEREGGGFANALNLAQAKTRLALGEFAENHPIANTALTAGAGALAGSRLAKTFSKAP